MARYWFAGKIGSRSLLMHARTESRTSRARMHECEHAHACHACAHYLSLRPSPRTLIEGLAAASQKPKARDRLRDSGHALRWRRAMAGECLSNSSCRPHVYATGGRQAEIWSRAQHEPTAEERLSVDIRQRRVPGQHTRAPKRSAKNR